MRKDKNTNLSHAKTRTIYDNVTLPHQNYREKNLTSKKNFVNFNFLYNFATYCVERTFSSAKR